MLRNYLLILVLFFSIISCNNKEYKLINNDQSVFDNSFHIKGLQVNQIQDIDTNIVIPTLPDYLIVSPGYYNIGKQNFDLNAEGLYRFIKINDRNIQRIVYSSDTMTLLSSLSWIVTHGNKDNFKDIDELMNLSKSSKLHLTCYYSSRWALKILQEQDIESRIVMGMTNDDWNNYDNGHTLLEVKVNNQWILFDIDNNVVFLSPERDKYLNFIELVQSLPNFDFEILSVANDISFSNPWYSENKYDLTLFAESYLSKSYIKNWYKRVLQFPFVLYNDKYFYYSTNSSSRIKKVITSNSDYQFLEKYKFDSLLYE